MITDLDDPASLDPATAGAKAAWLAVGRRCGLPILPGVVIDAAAGRAAMTLGAGMLERRGSGAARLAIIDMALDPDLASALPGAVAGLGPSLVVRSSSPLERDATWAGAFTSYLGVTADDLPTTIRGCWASAFSNGTVARAGLVGIEPADLSLAVLIQPAIRPDLGGSARIVDAEVLIVAVRGSPAPLLGGWDPGVHGRILPDDTIDGEALISLLGREAVRAVADVLRSAWVLTGATVCEWAIVDGRVTILQLGRDVVAEPVEQAPALCIDEPAEAARLERMARIARHAPGAMGETLVLPWAMGEAPWPGRDGTAGRAPEAGQPEDPTIEAMDPRAALAAAIDLARDLTMAVWRLPGESEVDTLDRAGRVVADLRGPDLLASAATIADRPAADPSAGARVRRLLARVRSALVSTGVTATDHDGWYLTCEQAAVALTDPSTTGRARRPRLDPWMPFQAAVILAVGQRRSGVASGPGLGVGRLAVVDDARCPDQVRSRDVVVAARPLPHLAPLLWDAAAIVTAGGGPGAHLFESARALGVPAVSAVGVDDLLASVLAGGPDSWAIAVDGTAGTVAITPW